MTIEVSDREFNTILAAIRYWQANEMYNEKYRSAEYDIIARGEDGESLADHEIDKLCERINLD